MPTSQALAMAQEKQLDLVEISPQAKPPVCKIMDYSRHRFALDQKRKANKKTQTRTQLKGMNFRPNTDVGDYNIKLKKITAFIEKGHKVKVCLRFRGREMQHRELGMTLLTRLQTDLEGIAQAESLPKLEGRQVFMVLAPCK